MEKKSFKIIISFVFSFIIFIFLTGCFEREDVKSEEIIEEGKEVMFETIAKDFYSGQTQKENFVIENEDDFMSLWDKIYPEPRPDIPDVDFEKYTVIAVFQGQMTTGGYEIRVNKVVEEKNNILVYIEEISPDPQDIVTQALTSPYHIIKMERTEKDIIFKQI